MSRDFTVLKTLGRGYYGTVYLVFEEKTKQSLVVKKTSLSRRDFYTRVSCQIEIALASCVCHSFIVPLHSGWLSNKHTGYVAMGHCRGGDLYERVQSAKKNHFPERTLKKWLSQLLLALDYLHDGGVLHRDVKAENVLLNDEDDVQLADFGLATYRIGGLWDDHSPVGTYCIQSPEMVRGERYGFASDVWYATPEINLSVITAPMQQPV